jgi:hypothetical protein
MRPPHPKIADLMNDPSGFFDQIAQEDASAAIAHPNDVRLALHAVTMLDAFFGILHASLYQSRVIQEQDDSKWKELLAQENKYYRVLRDCAYALRHGELCRKKPRLVRRPDQIVSKGGAFQSNAFQSNGFQMDKVWIETEEGDYRADVVIKNVLEIARQSLLKYGFTLDS